jgi:hypothetical protein
MNISELVPQPSHCETFARNRVRFIPDRPGCYVLTTFPKVVLYIGQATNLRRRMGAHLDSSEKTKETKSGRAILFFWFECLDLSRVERTWMNIHLIQDGSLPELNSVYSPINA